LEITERGIGGTIVTLSQRFDAELMLKIKVFAKQITSSLTPDDKKPPQGS